MPKSAFYSLITGGISGIGRGIVDCLVARGDHVVVFDCIDQDDPRVQALTQRGILYHCLDIAHTTSIRAGFSWLDDQLKGHSLRLLVNNAGITRDTLALRMHEQQWDDVMNVNLKGAFFCAQQALLRMIKSPVCNEVGTRGYLINIASVVGLHGNPGQVNYAASKAGMVAMTKTLATEYAGRGILVNAVAPGFIQTPMTEKLSETIKEQIVSRIALKRFGTVHDVAHFIAFLSSGYADYLTGQVIALDGGMR